MADLENLKSEFPSAPFTKENRKNELISLIELLQSDRGYLEIPCTLAEPVLILTKHIGLGLQLLIVKHHCFSLPIAEYV